MVANGKKAYQSLKKKGFSESVSKSDDHKYLEFVHEGKIHFYTKLSHGSKKDLGLPLITQMALQCKLSKKEFMDLVNCPLSKERYLEILKERGAI